MVRRPNGSTAYFTVLLAAEALAASLRGLIKILADWAGLDGFADLAGVAFFAGLLLTAFLAIFLAAFFTAFFTVFLLAAFTGFFDAFTGFFVIFRRR